MSRLTVSAFVSALVILTPNLAQAIEAPKQVEVSLEDIDTSSRAGADRALRRIRHAAEEACDLRRGLQPYRERAQARACAEEAVSNAVDSLGDPMVTARYRGAPRFARSGERS